MMINFIRWAKNLLWRSRPQNGDAINDGMMTVLMMGHANSARRLVGV